MILYTSDTDQRRISAAAVWLALSVICLIFSIVYECFSHDVISLNMLSIFAYPLLLECIPSFILSKKKLKLPCQVWRDGTIVLMLGALLSGIFEIYGTTSDFTVLYFIAGSILLAAGLIYDIFQYRSLGSSSSKEGC